MEECFICFEERDEFVFFPCAHKTCVACFAQMIQHYHKCPLCDSPIYLEQKQKQRQLQRQQRQQQQDDQVSECDVNRFCYSMCFLIVVMLIVYIIMQQ